MEKIGINKQSKKVIFAFSLDELISLSAAFSAAASDRYDDYLKSNDESDKEVFLSLSSRFSAFSGIVWESYKELKNEQK